MTKLYSFGTELRLRCAAHYKGVFDGALFKVHQPHFLFLAKRSELPNSRLGLVVAKKKVRRAHERNRVKRLARESFRLHQQQLDDLDIVIMPKMGVERSELIKGLRSYPLGKYILYYRIKDNDLEVVRVLSSSRDIDSIDW